MEIACSRYILTGAAARIEDTQRRVSVHEERKERLEEGKDLRDRGGEVVQPRETARNPEMTFY